MPPRLTRQQLDGATILSLEDHALPTARFALGLRRGGGDDPLGSAGACRTMLELCLRGTLRRDRAAFADALETMGSSLWAGCGRELALISGACLGRNLQATMELAREAICEPAFASDERRALIDEQVVDLRGMRDDDASVADVFLSRGLYGDHPLWRSPDGEVADLLQLDDAGVRAAYARHWVREDLVLAFAGDVTPELALELARPLVEATPRRQSGAPAPTPPARRPGVNILVVDKPERTQIQMRLGCLTTTGDQPDILALWLGVLAFGGTFTSPFTHEVREKRGWSYSAHAGIDRRRRNPAPLVMSTAPALADAVDCLALQLELYGQAARGELEEGSIALARAYALNRFPFEVATAADMITVAILYECLGKPLQAILDFPAELSAISADEVRQAMRRRLRADEISAVLVATAADVVEPLRARLPGAHIEVVDYRDGLGGDPP